MTTSRRVPHGLVEVRQRRVGLGGAKKPRLHVTHRHFIFSVDFGDKTQEARSKERGVSYDMPELQHARVSYEVARKCT